MGMFSWGVHDPNRFNYSADRLAMGTQRDAQGNVISIIDRKPNLKLRIGTIQENKFGLDLDAMYTWWQVFSSSPNTIWSLAKRNCASVVAKCLLAGGASSYAKNPNPVLWTPKNVFEWAEKIHAKIESLNDMAGEIEKAKNTPRDTSQDKRDPWSVAEWKKQSDAGMFAHRYASLKKIDHALQLFHGTALISDDLDTFKKSLENKETAAIEVLRLIHEQLVARPDSKRLAAIITLGQQILNYKDILNEYIKKFRDKVARVDAVHAQVAIEHQEEVDDEPEKQSPKFYGIDEVLGERNSQ